MYPHSKSKRGSSPVAPIFAPSHGRLAMLAGARSSRPPARAPPRAPPRPPATLSTMPYDIIFLISRACDSREDVAALSLTNNVMYYFLKADVTPALAGYVAISSLSSENICRVYRLYGPESLRLGLTRINPFTRRYALQRIVDTDDVEIFDLVARFITPADPLLDSLLEYLMARGFVHWLDAVLPYFEIKQIELGLRHSVTGNNEPFSRKLLSFLPEHMQPSAFNGKLLERVVVRNLREVRALVFDHVTIASYSGGIHTVLSDNRPHSYTSADICDVVGRLLAAGYPPNIVLWGGRNLLHNLAINGPESLGLARRYGPIPVACMPGGDKLHLYCTRALIAAGTDFELGDTNGRTPLFLAIRHGEAIMVRELINAGANIDAVDNTGRAMEDVENLEELPEDSKVRECVRLVKHRREELRQEVASEAMREMERALATRREYKANQRWRVLSQMRDIIRKEKKGRKRPASPTAGPSKVTVEPDGAAHEAEEAMVEPVVEGAGVRGPAKRQKRAAKVISSGHRPVTRASRAAQMASAANNNPAHATSIKTEGDQAPAQRRVQPSRNAKKQGELTESHQMLSAAI